MPTIGFQGEPGAFSDQAAQALVSGCTTVGYTDFDTLIKATSLRKVDAGLLPVENSIFGAIARAYDLLWDTPGLHIVEETTIAVEMCLIGVPGATERGIVEVRSHAVALEQVRHFTDLHPKWQRTAVDDTAGAVAEIMRLGDPKVAAIGPAFAAIRYGATVMRRRIQDDAQNFTRFYLLALAATEPRSDRAVVGIEIPHRPGSLRDALSAFADRRIDLRNIVARPNHVDPFHYRFFFEVRAVDGDRLTDALAAVDGKTRLFGRY